MARFSVYLAAPLFCESERIFNNGFKTRLFELCDVFLPQEDGFLMTTLIANGSSPEEATRIVFMHDLHAIRKCDVVIAVLDGRTIDEGVAFEIGVGHTLGKICVGFQTDVRRLAPFGNNPMISGALADVFNEIEDLLNWIKDRAMQLSRR